MSERVDEADDESVASSTAVRHWPTLIFRDGEAGDLCRCDCGAQGFDYNDGRDWFAEHMGLGAREQKSELYRRQAERAAADVAKWPEWMRRNLTPARRGAS